jgi:hypothetical protein
MYYYYYYYYYYHYYVPLLHHYSHHHSGALSRIVDHDFLLIIRCKNGLTISYFAWTWTEEEEERRVKNFFPLLI